MLRMFGASYSLHHLLMFTRFLRVCFFTILTHRYEKNMPSPLNSSGATKQMTTICSPQRNAAWTFNAVEKTCNLTVRSETHWKSLFARHC